MERRGQFRQGLEVNGTSQKVSDRSNKVRGRSNKVESNTGMGMTAEDRRRKYQGPWSVPPDGNVEAQNLPDYYGLSLQQRQDMERMRWRNTDHTNPHSERQQDDDAFTESVIQDVGQRKKSKDDKQGLKGNNKEGFGKFAERKLRRYATPTAAMALGGMAGGPPLAFAVGVTWELYGEEIDRKAEKAVGKLKSLGKDLRSRYE